MYYQGWFTFPLGHYKDIFEHDTGLPYSKHWVLPRALVQPGGHVHSKEVAMSSETEVPAIFDRAESVFFAGEQLRKRRTTIAENVRTWGDHYDGRKIRFASFVPPGATT